MGLLGSAFELAHSQHEARPQFAWWSRCLANCESQWSNSLVLLHEHEKAQHMLRSAVQRWEQVGSASDRWEAARARYRLALLLLFQGKPKKAATEFELALPVLETVYSTHPDEPWISRPLLAALAFEPFTKSRYTEQLLDVASRHADGTGLLRRYLAMAQYRAEKHEAALRLALDGIRHRNGGDAMDWFIASLASRGMGDHDAANRYYEKAVTAIDAKAPIVFGEGGPLVVRFLHEEARKALHD